MNLGPLTLLAMASALAQLPASPDPKPIPITGVVVDDRSQPAAGAEVWLIEMMTPEEGRQPGRESPGPISDWSNDRTPSIKAHARTDGAGRFILDVPVEVVARRSPPPLALWAAVVGKDARVAWHRPPRVVLADDPPVRIELGVAAHAELTVLGPDQKPVAGARVIPIRAGEVPIPEPLGQSLAASSNATGRVSVPGLASTALGAVRIEAGGFGMQTLEIPDVRFQTPDPKIQTSSNGNITIAPAPVGRVVGRLVAPGDEPIRGVTVRVTSQVGGYDGSGIVGSAEVVCDEQGRFEIPAIAAGMMALALEFDPEKGTTLRPWPISKILVRAGRTTEVAIPLHPTVKVQGMVREKATDRPIAGVKIRWAGLWDGFRFAVTGTAGTYRAFSQREEVRAAGYPIGIPNPYFMPTDWVAARRDLPPRGVDEQTLAPIELPRGVDVSGTVVDEWGQPVAGAAIEAIRGTFVESIGLTRSDRSGGFVLHGIDPRSELILTAWDGLASSTAIAVRPEAAATRPITLTIAPKLAPRTDRRADRRFHRQADRRRVGPDLALGGPGSEPNETISSFSSIRSRSRTARSRRVPTPRGATAPTAGSRPTSPITSMSTHRTGSPSDRPRSSRPSRPASSHPSCCADFGPSRDR